MERQIKETKVRAQQAHKKSNKENMPSNTNIFPHEKDLKSSSSCISAKMKPSATMVLEEPLSENSEKSKMPSAETMEPKKLINELRMVKKALIESQARNSANIKELAKLQNENANLRSKQRGMQDIIEKSIVDKQYLEKIVSELKYEKTEILKENEALKSQLQVYIQNLQKNSHEECNSLIETLQKNKHVF